MSHSWCSAETLDDPNMIFWCTLYDILIYHIWSANTKCIWKHTHFCSIFWTGSRKHWRSHFYMKCTLVYVSWHILGHEGINLLNPNMSWISTNSPRIPRNQLVDPKRSSNTLLLTLPSDTDFDVCYNLSILLCLVSSSFWSCSSTSNFRSSRNCAYSSASSFFTTSMPRLWAWPIIDLHTVSKLTNLNVGSWDLICAIS